MCADMARLKPLAASPTRLNTLTFPSTHALTTPLVSTTHQPSPRPTPSPAPTTPKVGDIGLMGAPAKLNGKAVEGVRIFLGGKVCACVGGGMEGPVVGAPSPD
jgi:hypothetical protein